MSLRTKTYLFFGTLLVFTLLTTTGILISNARQSVHVKVEEAMTAAAHLITVAIPPTLSRNSPSAHQRMGRLVKVISEIRGLYIMVYRSGQPLYAGGPTPNKSVTPPELLVKYLSPTIQPLITRAGGGTIVIYAAPLEEINERWLDIRALLTLGVGLSIFIILILYIGINRILKPLEYLSGALAGFEQGNLHLRLPNFSLQEMDHLSEAFNRMGKALLSSTEENQRLATLVKQSVDAILSLDHEGRIIFYNPTAEQMLPQLNPNSVGHSFLNLEFGEHQQKIARIIEHHEAIDNLEIVISGKHQDTVDLLLSISPCLNVGENAIGFICTLRDVTEHKHAEQAKNLLLESRLLTQHISKVQENERRSLARELHDELGQCLTVIKTDAVLIRNRTESMDKKVFYSAQSIIDVTSHIYDVVHQMLSRLRPSPLDDLGLVLTLQDTISTWQKRQPGIEFHLDLIGELDGLDEETNMTIFRIVQESITNAVRHAECTKIGISIANNSDTNLLLIDSYDNGKGMYLKDIYSDVDFGILGMRERVQSLKGDFQLTSSLGQGVSLKIKIPLSTEIQT